SRWLLCFLSSSTESRPTNLRERWFGHSLRTQRRHNYALENSDSFIGDRDVRARADGNAGHYDDRIRETSVHVRGHDEAETGRRAGAIAGREMGGFRRGRCRSRGEYENLPSLDRVRSRRRSAPVESNAESRGAPAIFTGREATHLDFEGDRPAANLDVQLHAR